MRVFNRQASHLLKFEQRMQNLRNITRQLNSNVFKQGISAPATDTIFALSSGPVVKSGVAVVRLSGPACREILTILQNAPLISSNKIASLSTKPIPFPEPRRASVRTLICPKTGDELDRAMVIWMPGPHSFTGEDVCELHLHGSRAVVSGLFQALEHLDAPTRGRGIRAAAKGEFTRRAFENNRMDLTEIEGLSDLLDADTALQRKQALRQMDGHLSKQFEVWRRVLVQCLAHTEAVIDFGDDDRELDIDESAMTKLFPIVQQLRDEIEAHLKDGRRGELVREGVRISLVGPPNAGKSTMLNLLARRPAAIVSPIAGTTRDIVEVRLELGGIPCIVSDTAGLREHATDVVESEGIRRAKEAFKQAHIKVFVVDAGNVSEMHSAYAMFQHLLKELNEEEPKDLLSSNSAQREHVIDVPSAESVYGSERDTSSDARVAIVLNKIDLLKGGVEEAEKLSANVQNGMPVYAVSCATGHGVADLENALHAAVKKMLSTSHTESTLITRERHRRHLKICAQHLDKFLHLKLQMDTAAEELRLAALELGRVSGRVDIEELLDVIFRDFCIGK